MREYGRYEMRLRTVVAVAMVCVSVATLAAQEATGIGLQITTKGLTGSSLYGASSHGSMGVVYRGGAVEAGVMAQAIVFDTEAEGDTPGVLRLGAHGAYLFGDPAAPRRFGIGAEFGTGLGTDDVQYDEYIDFGPRVSLDQMIGSRAYVSALVYPLWIETRDFEEGEDDWTLTATFPSARLAVTFLF
jgi:hypothetical protein